MGALRLGYNTSGFARTKDLLEVLDSVAAIGYVGVELTFDQRHFHPDQATPARTRAIADRLRERGLGVVLGTGARYVLSEVKHEPALVSAEAEARERYLEFILKTVDLAPALGCGVVMLHSGYAPLGVEPERASEFAVSGLRRLAARAADRGVVLALEFHPDMFIRDLADFWSVQRAVGMPALKLTLDVGHSVCTDPRPPREVIAECASEIANVHLEDIKNRKHVHLPIGDGDIDFGAVFRALAQAGYRGLVNPEFNTDDLAVEEVALAKRTFERLAPLVPA